MLQQSLGMFADTNPLHFQRTSRSTVGRDRAQRLCHPGMADIDGELILHSR